MQEYRAAEPVRLCKLVDDLKAKINGKLNGVREDLADITEFAYLVKTDLYSRWQRATAIATRDTYRAQTVASVTAYSNNMAQRQ